MKPIEKFYSNKLDKDIVISKPWSKEMYAHNEAVRESIITKVTERWNKAYDEAETAFEEGLEEDQKGLYFLEEEWSYNSSDKLEEIQKAVTYYSYGSGHSVGDVADEVYQDLENAPFHRLKELAEELDLDDVEIIGFK